jgi:hypothetical protein
MQHAAGALMAAPRTMEDTTMGFTRYWTRPRELDAERFRTFAEACQEVCAELVDNLADPAFTTEDVRFGGNPGCETFLIERVSTRGRGEEPVFEFCKTQHLPYDAVVGRCLRILKEHFPRGRDFRACLSGADSQSGMPESGVDSGIRSCTLRRVNP